MNQKNQSRSVWQLGAAALLAAAIAAPAQAAIISVSKTAASTGALAEIIAAPKAVLNSDIINRGQQGFDEAQGVTTSMAYNTQGGVIPEGSTVDSHMIFFNTMGTNTSTHIDVLWTFSGKILGVMGDKAGNQEAASTKELGAAGTIYTSGNASEAAPYNARGLEGSDNYSIIAPNVLRLSMYVSEPGDWIRVVTASAVPEPGSIGLLALGAMGLLSLRRRTIG